MAKYRSNNIVYFLIIAFVIFILFQLLGVLLLIIRGLFFIVFKFWYLFLAVGLVWYFSKKVKVPKKGTRKYHVENNQDGKTIEINDYKVK